MTPFHSVSSITFSPSKQYQQLANPVGSLFSSVITYEICTTHYHLVGQGGADPPTPEGNGFTVRRSCRFATDPYNYTLVFCFNI